MGEILLHLRGPLISARDRTRSCGSEPDDDFSPDNLPRGWSGRDEEVRLVVEQTGRTSERHVQLDAAPGSPLGHPALIQVQDGRINVKRRHDPIAPLLRAVLQQGIVGEPTGFVNRFVRNNFQDDSKVGAVEHERTVARPADRTAVSPVHIENEGQPRVGARAPRAPAERGSYRTATSARALRSAA